MNSAISLKQQIPSSNKVHPEMMPLKGWWNLRFRDNGGIDARGTGSVWLGLLARSSAVRDGGGAEFLARNITRKK